MTRPEDGSTRPMMVAMVVVLPAPLPPSSAVQDPGRERKGNAVHGGHGLVDLDQTVDGDGGSAEVGASMAQM